MRNDRFLATYLLFLLLFFSSMAFRFESEIFNPSPQAGASPSVFMLLLLAALFLVFSLRSVFKARAVFMIFVSLLVTMALFMGVLRFEDKAIEKAWLKNSSTRDFSRLAGHCAPRVGRTMVRLLDRIFKGKNEREDRELRIDSECRLRHFRYLANHGVKLCSSNENGSKCNLRWVGIFGQAGKWDYSTRAYFFERSLDSWQKDLDTEALVSFVIKDQELATMASVDAGNDEYLSLSRTIFDKVGEVVRDQNSKSKPEPYYFKFRDAQSEYLSRFKER